MPWKTSAARTGTSSTTAAVRGRTSAAAGWLTSYSARRERSGRGGPMTEAEWLACDDLTPMLGHLKKRAEQGRKSLAVLTSFEPSVFRSPEEWREQFRKAQVHLQWDPERS